MLIGPALSIDDGVSGERTTSSFPAVAQRLHPVLHLPICRQHPTGDLAAMGDNILRKAVCELRLDDHPFPYKAARAEAAPRLHQCDEQQQEAWPDPDGLPGVGRRHLRHGQEREDGGSSRSPDLEHMVEGCHSSVHDASDPKAASKRPRPFIIQCSRRPLSRRHCRTGRQVSAKPNTAPARRHWA